MTSSPCFIVTTRPLSDSLSFGISQTHSHLKPTLAESTQCFWFRRPFPTRTVLTFQQQRCLVYLIFGRTKGSFSGLLPGNSSSAVKHDRHFCGWLTSSAVALCVSSVLEVHHPANPQQWILEPHPTTIGSWAPQVQNLSKKPPLRPCCPDERVKKGDQSDKTHLESWAY